jgi:predicted esterase
MVYPGIRIPAMKPATASMIFLHGIGDSGKGWKFLAEEAQKSPKLQHINFIFPDAPLKPVTMNFGMTMPAWYDFKTLEDVNHQPDEAGIISSLDILKSLIHEENSKGIPSTRIIIGGFSQGSVVALTTAVTTETKLAGVVCLSGYLGIQQKLQTLKSGVNCKIPIFLGHGTADNVIKLELGQNAYKALKQDFGFENAELHVYKNLVHSVSPEELGEIFNFVDRVVGNEER